jgi:5'-3' exonuclease
MENLILVDTSYTTYYRFFATSRWMKIAHPEIENPFESDIFIEKYKKLYLESIIKLIGKKIFNNSKIIFCMDTSKNNVWRNKIKSDYKGDRCNINIHKPTFTYTYDDIIPEILKNNSNISSLRFDHLEADDIIAIICNYFEINYPKTNIYLISGDNDFLQLGRDNLYFINYKQKELVTLSKDEALIKLHNKILLGDTSDCIKSIFLNSKIKPKLKKELVLSIEKFNEYIKTNNEIEKKYIENRKLIDFNFIPKKYQDIVLNKLHELFSN